MPAQSITLNPGDTLTITVAGSGSSNNENNNMGNIVKIPYVYPNNTNANPTEGGGKKNKTRKQEGGKKKALSGFMKFCKDERPSVMKENPGIAFTAVGKELGKRWRSLSEAEKSKY